MNLSRTSAVFRLDLSRYAKRPLLWFLILLAGYLTWQMSTGEATINSGDSSVGGTKAWLTSMFAQGMVMSMMVFTMYTFFLAVAAGMAVIKDGERKIGEILHTTPLTAAEYIWGKFGAVLTAFLGVLCLHTFLAILFNHVVPNPVAAEVRGPFELLNYLVPALVFGIPPILFIAGTTFAIGERFRKPILVFVLPLVLLLACGFFLMNWSPTWLDPRINTLLGLLDPSGFRWLNETWLKVDRGVDFYNTQPIGFDIPFLLSRVFFCLAGLGAVEWSRRRFEATLRGSGKVKSKKKKALHGAPQESTASPKPLRDLGMVSRPVGLVRGALEVARVEFRELISHPGLYLFVPLIIIQTFGSLVSAGGAMEGEILITPGHTAARMMNTLTLLVCLLLLFYTVESLWRDRSTGLGSIIYASPTRSASILFGKALANSLVGAAILLAALVTCVIVILIQGTVPFSFTPFLLLWGLLLIPTFLLWTSFTTAVFAITRNRYVTYGVALAALIMSAFYQLRGEMNWVGNWNLWSVVNWSDMGPLQVDRLALILNRAMALGLTVLFVALAVRFFPRTSKDPILVIHRMRPKSLLFGFARLSLFVIVPLVVGVALWIQVEHGFQGSVAEKENKDYWKQNLATWKDAPLPQLTDVQLDLDLEPAEGFFKAEGSYRFKNNREKPLAQIPLTAGRHWENISWTLNGEAYEPDDRSKLFVFTPETPLATGEELTIGFAYEGILPKGISKNGGRVGEFILPSGIVLTSFSPSFVPVPGYMEEIGIDKENRYESRVYPDDFYEGETEPLYGAAAPFTTNISVTVPDDYIANSVGILESESATDGRRTFVWRSDVPVRFFNVIAGKWDVKRGEGTALYHHPGHPYNVVEMSEALEAAREHYSEWFHPFPWKELKLSEFPDVARYAQGFPTNITFSEGIGFLADSDPRSNVAFAVTAHESAHQWWGNLVTPGKGPSGNVVAEGLAQFSTTLLLEEEKGFLAGVEFRKRMEEHYGNRRYPDAEKPLVKIDGTKAGDTVVTYEKGGWAFWMLHEQMGPEASFAGLKAFCERYKDGPDYPVIHDYLQTLREFAPDPEAFDAFTQTWFYEVVVPEYKLSDVNVEKEGETWEVWVTVRNDGTGTLPIEVAAAKDDRMGEEGEALPDYRDSRTTITVGPGEEKEAFIVCDFEPDRVLVDPDAKVLQLERRKALQHISM